MRFVRGVLFSTAVVCATLAASASAASAADYSANITPNTVAPGSKTTFTVLLQSESQTNPLNAALITPPKGFTISAVSLAKPSGNATVTMQNGQVVLKGISLKLHQNPSTSVLVTATAPSTSCESSSWTVQAFKSSLNGTLLALDTQNSQLGTTTPCPPAAVKFANEPSSAYIGQTISKVPFTPTGAPVTVDVVDANGNIVDSSAPVTIVLGNNPGGSTLSPSSTVTQKAVNGVATFSNLSLNNPGSGYTLVASSTGLTGDTSTPFGENSLTVSCPGGTCPATTLNAPGTPPASSITVTTTGSPGDTGTLNLSVDTGTKPTCSTEVPGLDQNFYGVVYTPNNPPSPGTNDNQVAKQIIYTIFNTGGATDNLCFAAPYTFETLGDGIPNSGPLPDGTQGFIGFLENCDSSKDGSTPDPCQTVAASGSNTVFTITIPAGEPGDPWVRG